MLLRLLMVLVLASCLPACDLLLGSSGDTGDEPVWDERCDAPLEAIVDRVLDGDTVELDSGDQVRYLMIDTPETSPQECYGPEAKEFNTQLVEGQTITLAYDVECTDDFGRLLAYVYLDDTEINMLLIERGYACVLMIPPNGVDREDEFRTAEALAESKGRGMWAACDPVPCDQ